MRPRRARPPRTARLGRWLALLAVVVVAVGTTASTGLLALVDGVARPWTDASFIVPAPSPAPSPEPPADDAAGLEQSLRAVAMVRAPCGTGCATVGGGVAVGASEVLTAAHVVEGSGSVLVVTESGQALAAEVVLTAAGPDLALLRTQRPHGLPMVELRADEPVVGEEAWAAGYPAGERRVSKGAVTGLIDLGDDGIIEVQTDAPIDPGNSGGPLLDGRGRLLGIVVQEHQTDPSAAWATGSDAVALFLAQALELPGDPGAQRQPLPDPVEGLFEGLSGSALAPQQFR